MVGAPQGAEELDAEALPSAADLSDAGPIRASAARSSIGRRLG